MIHIPSESEKKGKRRPAWFEYSRLLMNKLGESMKKKRKEKLNIKKVHTYAANQRDTQEAFR